MNLDVSTSPRTFISYSWSSPTHEVWVLTLASRLREDGVDVVLDKWDLKPGHDSVKFMESMVNDPLVKKVIMVCDKAYAEKANARTGGVGTESQIISPEIYASSTQDKFAAILTESDEHGKAYLPTYYRGRMYVDFRSGETYEDAYEQLLRWLVDRPQHVKPKLGQIPEAILSANPNASGTQSKSRRAENAIRQNTSNAAPYLRDYGDALIEEIRALTPNFESDAPADEVVLDAVKSLRPYIRQFTELVLTAVRYSEDNRVWDSILFTLERVGQLAWPSRSLSTYHPLQFDPFKIISHDLFVSTVAVTLDEERFDLTIMIFSRAWLVRELAATGRQSTSDFTAFNQNVSSLDQRKQRLKLNRYSLHADIVHEAHKAGSFPSFDSILQAEFVIFLRSIGQSNHFYWYPFPLIYALDRYVPFPVFARAESMQYFSRIASVLGVPDIAEFKRRLDDDELKRRSRQMFNYHDLELKLLANADFLGIRA